MPRTPSLSERLLRLPGKIVSWLIIPLAVTVVISVVAARMGWSVLLDWDGVAPIFGRALTINSLVDFQWYSFALIVLFGGIWTFFEDRHVTVDFLSVNMRPRTRLWIKVFGDLFLLLPFCLLIVWYGSKFAETSWRTGESSNQGGLAAHWLIKGALPVSFGMLGMAALLRAWTNGRRLLSGPADEIENNDAG